MLFDDIQSSVVYKHAFIVLSDGDPGGGCETIDCKIDGDAIIVPYHKVYGGGVDAVLFASVYTNGDGEASSYTSDVYLGHGDVEEQRISWPKDGWVKDF